jgi:hypothetical protein
VHAPPARTVARAGFRAKDVKDLKEKGSRVRGVRYRIPGLGYRVWDMEFWDIGFGI